MKDSSMKPIYSDDDASEVRTPDLMNATLSDPPPRRPASAYNVYYQLERQKILREYDSEDINQVPKRDPYKKEDIMEFLEQKGKSNSDPQRQKRKHVKTHGKISFVELAREAARRWKSLPPSERNLFHSYFETEMRRYRVELQLWKKRNFNKTNETNKKLESEASCDQTRPKDTNHEPIVIEDCSNNGDDNDFELEVLPPPFLASTSSSFSKWNLGDFEAFDVPCITPPSPAKTSNIKGCFSRSVANVDQINGANGRSHQQYDNKFTSDSNLMNDMNLAMQEEALQMQLVELRMQMHKQAQIISQLKINSLIHQTKQGSNVIQEKLPFGNTTRNNYNPTTNNYNPTKLDTLILENCHSFVGFESVGDLPSYESQSHSLGIPANTIVSNSGMGRTLEQYDDPRTIGQWNQSNHDMYYVTSPPCVNLISEASDEVRKDYEPSDSHEKGSTQFQDITQSSSKFDSSKFEWDLDRGIDYFDPEMYNRLMEFSNE